MNKFSTSFEENSDHVSYLHNISSVRQEEAISVRDTISDNYAYFYRFLEHLPKIDQEMARFYYIDKLSQTQIANLFGICQAAVSYRLKFILSRIKFIIKMPTLNPLQVREDFKKIFPQDLYEFAYMFYFIRSQNRVKNFIMTSQSGASNKHSQIIKHLESLKEETEDDKGDLEVAEIHYLVLVYLDYFRYIKKYSNVLSCLYKKKGLRKHNTFVKGKNLFEDDLAPESLR